MSQRLSDDELRRYVAAGKKAAAAVSRDPQVIEESANHATQRLDELLDSIAESRPAREQWVRITAQRHALRIGEKLHREPAFGRQGSLPPKQSDDRVDEFVRRTIAEMDQGHESLGSLVANKVAFNQAWALLASDTRDLLEDRYVDGKSAAQIADERDLAAGTVHRKLNEAKEAVRPLLEDLYHDLFG